MIGVVLVILGVAVVNHLRAEGAAAIEDAPAVTGPGAPESSLLH